MTKGFLPTFSLQNELIRQCNGQRIETNRPVLIGREKQEVPSIV